ncbi:MAG: 3-alpha,7-alpha,12-alpha-trihydroxy-5-beta-cholest-24-enoyl-CoA hydratase [Gammaproteobacteria bacterium]|jgi:acyl dehydratase|nr:3-alpha,7-alpha,12-alpha-trihydroxy-5-beta-cholest-24-enoyl-CoA hydratase [Gammaproteobacteria bacterium]MBT4493041.1 3-alpha,7-alpha,12-alpha-trihydroxy-5-beta-cholest-24-enoyl-CoA hydratase [Gammaproteobacteria bacterium]MBT7369923.1 3-alpha,7-alpha,12-alpha-trihydroxy-5-beta-cholest-24-enoyl-CoA hydratase [Gammaproteobacteria bacterium]
MPITVADVEEALAIEPEEIPGEYTDRDSLLYAVAIGMGKDPLDEKELEYVCETVGNRVVPTASSVLTNPSSVASNASKLTEKMNYVLMLHGEQRLQIHQPLPPSANTLISNRITGVYDKGEGKGALVTNETSVKLEDGSPLYTIGGTMFFRGDGGFGGSAEGAPVPHTLPDREPDSICELPQRKDQPMVYALCGDRNPLHRDPGVARQAGFDVPIQHGLCSYGIACHAVLKTMLDYDQTRMKSFDVRFSTPVFPGETHLVEMWRDDNIVSFRTRIKERDVIAINNGKCVVA